MARTAVIDFGGETFSRQELDDGQWGAFVNASQVQADAQLSSFDSMFVPGASSILDMNNVGGVDQTDARIAKNKILQKVRQDFAPYDLTIFASDFNSNSWRLTDSREGDVAVVVSGGTMSELGTLPSAQGVAPWTDLGNENDEVVFAFGNSILNASSTSDNFVNQVARVISQEMAHAFGLGHIQTGVVFNTNAQPNHIMNIDFTTAARFNPNADPNFQNITYATDIGGGFRVAESTDNPLFTIPNSINQNAHQILSNPDVLGPSQNAWVAALRPGELTINGSGRDDQIDIVQQDPNTWSVQIRTKIPWYSRFTYYRTSSAIVDTIRPSIDSVNPYTTQISLVRVNGNDGNDNITMGAAITTRMIASGGAGVDVIQGGAGNDFILGGDGDDQIFGGRGNDTLLGGDGVDLVMGELGNDTLYGYTTFGDDGDLDILDGGQEDDRYGVRSITSPEDAIFDQIGNDTRNLYFNPFRFRRILRR